MIAGIVTGTFPSTKAIFGGEETVVVAGLNVVGCIDDIPGENG
jgi:hypothetical protein